MTTDRLVREKVGASREAHRRAGRREVAMDGSSSQLAARLRQSHRRRPHFIGRHRLPGRLHRQLPAASHSGLDGAVQVLPDHLLQPVLLVAVSRRSDQDQGLEHRGFAHRRLLHRQRSHRAQLQKMVSFN